MFCQGPDSAHVHGVVEHITLWRWGIGSNTALSSASRELCMPGTLEVFCSGHHSFHLLNITPFGDDTDVFHQEMLYGWVTCSEDRMTVPLC